MSVEGTPSCTMCAPLGGGGGRLWKESDPDWVGTFSNVPPDLQERLQHVAGDDTTCSSRGRGLYRCKACGAFFEYVRSYEFLVGGSEDEETWTRVSAEHVRAHWPEVA